ncbi:MAG: hypothetical protein V4598_19620 [Bdellovibrionota bacterium]
MNKIIFSVLLLSSSATVLAQGQQDCSQLLAGSDARLGCEQRQMASGNQRGQQQRLQVSDTVRSCAAVLSIAAPESTEEAETPAQPGSTEVVRRDASGNVTGTETTTIRPPVSATRTARVQGMTSSPPNSLVWLNINTPPTTPVPTPVPVITDPTTARNCRALQMTSAGNRQAFAAHESKTSMDGRVTCIQYAGFTADYRSCTNAVNMYNNVKMAESALFIVQSVQATSNQQNVANETAQRVANGDGQNAAYDAQISQARAASQLNQQKAAAYAAAVLALGSQIRSWIKTDVASLQAALCAGNPRALGEEVIFNDAQATEAQFRTFKFSNAKAVGSPVCRDAVKYTHESANGEMIANQQAKGQLTAALMELIGKGIQAGIAANQLGNIAKKVEEAKNATEDPYNPATFDVCAVNMADPRCAQAGTRTPGTGLQDGGFSFGDGFGNNAFTPIGSAEDMENVAPGALPGDSVVGDTTNPFVDDAKKASGILDPAGAASTQAAAAGGGGGSGGGGAGGGGSASLGNDTPGADDSKKENDIKANKADGKYGSFAGGGFQAIKPMKDENPFANLFDGKGGGSLQEDRSIASGDIDGRDSGIFSKISKRYGQVQADKRIEAKNLEE